MQKHRVLRGPAELGGAWGRQKRAQDSPNHVDVNRRPQIVKVEKTSSLWWPGGTAGRRWGGGYHSVIGGKASFVGAACPSRFRFSMVVVQFFKDRALGVARAVAFPPTGCQASVHPHYCLLGFSHRNSPTVCAWLVRHGRRACGVWQAPNAINSNIWLHFFRK